MIFTRVATTSIRPLTAFSSLAIRQCCSCRQFSTRLWLSTNVTDEAKNVAAGSEVRPINKKKITKKFIKFIDTAKHPVTAMPLELQGSMQRHLQILKNASEPIENTVHVPKRVNKWALPQLKVLKPGEIDEQVPKLQAKLPENWRDIPDLPKWRREKYETIEKLEHQAWRPRKRVPPSSRAWIREFKDNNPTVPIEELAAMFGTSHMAIKRILKSNYVPQSSSEYDQIMKRWNNRKERIINTWKNIGRR
ncbi:hypothetical protein V1514DRAFT_335273 [Lipomyces japonicus]|uniref:uncharacterized protein n=1 Tax=Lipomyces japonicus TaxID=56871 RepID=UPI0034D0131C